ncbi:MAG TPA: DUF3048 domain-containing protein [Candidatus Limnocylindria bacterium]|jgi:hypothetical protein|nr:DUF3048 domain-containing protein [Candidatus Limnocylindria bacterium]
MEALVKLRAWAGPRRRGLAAGMTVGAFAVFALFLLAAPRELPPPPPTPSFSPVPTPVAVATPSPTASPTASPSAAPTEPAPQTPPPLAGFGRLDGAPADPLLANRLPLAVMIDNNPRARPQAGFNRASIVYQAPNDGGTDRYMLIFQQHDAELVGPVRSTRLFFNSWAFEYRPGFAHFGGDWKSVTRLEEVDGQMVYDIDALDGSGRAYWRTDKIRAPYNAYTDTHRLRTEAERLGAPALMADGLPVRQFRQDLPARVRPLSGHIHVPYRHGAIDYDYDHTTNSYLRSVAGQPHLDALDGSRVTARNVIVQFVDVYYDPNQRYNRAVMEFVGEGRAIVFRDGLAFEGTWRKPKLSGLTRFYDAAGREIRLARGPIYIQVLSDRLEVDYEVGPLP